MIYFASGNSHKKAEMEALFHGVSIFLPSEQGITFAPDETGSTFLENALIKARSLWDVVHAPVLADDSGLCVDALDGRPGIFSARYGGDVSSFEKNRLLLEEVGNIPAEKRNCRFVCVLVFFLTPDRFFIAQETLEGRLVSSIEESCGSGGFGYDPIVVIDSGGASRTVAELNAKEKNTISHRGKAAAALSPFIRSHGNL